MWKKLEFSVGNIVFVEYKIKKVCYRVNYTNPFLILSKPLKTVLVLPSIMVPVNLTKRQVGDCRGS